MHSIEKEIRWEMGHRLPNHPGKCKNMHGHSYRALFSFEAASLDVQGMVFDFYHFDDIKKDIDDRLDHAFMFQTSDPLGAAVKVAAFPGMKLVFTEQAPTAEHIAKSLFGLCEKWLAENKNFKPVGIRVKGVTVYETATCSATYTKEKHHHE